MKSAAIATTTFGVGLARRIIPTLLCRGRELIKGQQFKSWRSAGLAMQAARIHAMRGVDEIVLLDIGATPEGRGPDLDLVRELSECMFMPLAVGGGIRTIAHVEQLLRAGADKVVIGTALIDDPTLLPACKAHFGAQAIIASIDVYSGNVIKGCGKTLTAINAYRWPLACELHGAGEILLTSVVREGTMSGYDLGLIHEISKSLTIPLIANGGCGNYQHMIDALQVGADAVAAGAMFQFTDATPLEAARYLQKAGIEVRIPDEEAA